MAKTTKKPDFEKAMSKLESIVEQMEQGDLSLEASLKAFEEGIQLTRLCQSELKAAEQKVQQLVEKNGQLALEAFSQDDNDE